MPADPKVCWQARAFFFFFHIAHELLTSYLDDHSNPKMRFQVCARSGDGCSRFRSSSDCINDLTHIG